MKEVAQRVIDKLAGRRSRYDRDLQLRRTIWYHRWITFADFLDTNPGKRAILLAVDSLINSSRGYRHAFKAGASQEAVNLVIRERKYK